MNGYESVDSESRPVWRQKKMSFVVVALILCALSAVAVLKSRDSKNLSSMAGVDGKIGTAERVIIVGANYACPAGTERSPPGANGDCVCTKCPAGSFCVDGAANLCPLGQFQDLAGESTCKDSPAGNYVPGEGATQPTPCGKGTFQPQQGQSVCNNAQPGYKVPNEGAQAETPCPQGQYQPSEAQDHCIVADPGHFASGSGNTQQTACVEGKYQPDPEKGDCIDAVAGHFAKGTGNTAESPCAHGSYQPASVQGGCTLAAPGKFVGSQGATSDENCGTDTYQPCEGQSSCIICPPGQHQPNPGMIACTAVPVTSSTCIPANAGYATITVPTTGKLHGITLTHVSGEWKYCGPDSLPNCMGFWGIRSPDHGFDVYITKDEGVEGANSPNPPPILFPIKDQTNGFGFSSIATPATFPRPYPYYTLQGQTVDGPQVKLAAPNTDVTQGQVLRLYSGEVLIGFTTHDNSGSVCVNAQFHYAK